MDAFDFVKIMIESIKLAHQSKGEFANFSIATEKFRMRSRAKSTKDTFTLDGNLGSGGESRGTGGGEVRHFEKFIF
jgi:hypothetical protein